MLQILKRNDGGAGSWRERETERHRKRDVENNKDLAYVIELEVASVIFECALHKCTENLERGVMKFLGDFSKPLSSHLIILEIE